MFWLRDACPKHSANAPILNKAQFCIKPLFVFMRSSFYAKPATILPSGVHTTRCYDDIKLTKLTYKHAGIRQTRRSVAWLSNNQTRATSLTTGLITNDSGRVGSCMWFMLLKKLSAKPFENAETDREGSNVQSTTVITWSVCEMTVARPQTHCNT